jgi:nitrite reductase/ring-hydroxylating ferredoxin subunit
MCPWHRSHFDVQTGKVAQGPAKVDLKTYEASIENGQIQVRIPR